MQLSWIEADDIKQLLAKIAPETAQPTAKPLLERETSSLPEPDFHFVVNSEPPSALHSTVDALAATSESSSTSALAEVKKAPPPLPSPQPSYHSDLSLQSIHEKLRALRQKASEAGMLARPATPAPQPIVKPRSMWADA